MGIKIINSAVQNSCKHRFRYLTGSLDSIVYGYIITGIFPSDGLSIINIVSSILFLYGVYLLLLQIINNSKNSFKLDRIVYAFVFFVVSYSLFTFLRGASFNLVKLLTLLGNPNVGGLFWLLPFCIYIGKQPGVFQSLLPSFKKHAIIGLVITSFTILEVFIFKRSYVAENAFFSRQMSYTGVELLYGAPIVLLTGIAPSFNLKLFYRVCLVFTLFGALASSQRFYVMLSAIYIALDLVIGRSKNLNLTVQRLTIFFSSIGAVIIYFLINYYMVAFQTGEVVDTRSFLLEEVLLDFNMSDLIFGRGALGTYYSPYFDLQQMLGNTGDSPIRQTVEIGNMYMVLKSGVIGSASYLSIYALSIIVAVRSSQSRFTTGAILFIFLHLIEMSISGSPTIYPIRIVLWILVGVLLSRKKLPEYG